MTLVWISSSGYDSKFVFVFSTAFVGLCLLYYVYLNICCSLLLMVVFAQEQMVFWVSFEVFFGFALEFSGFFSVHVLVFFAGYFVLFCWLFWVLILYSFWLMFLGWCLANRLLFVGFLMNQRILTVKEMIRFLEFFFLLKNAEIKLNNN